ncbi:MAG TPA: DNA-binding protein [Lutibacter sp.]|nr:DNA-binding protein [Lutibacter sp.]
MKIENNIIVYDDGEIELEISMKNETIWLSQKQIAELFEVTIPNINMHIKAIFKEKELEKYATIQKFLIVQKEGNREVSRNVEHYNLDMILSVGYRVNSHKATKFRQWATKVLTQYIHSGYTINSEKITNERFKELELDVSVLKQKVNKIDSLVIDNTLDTKQGVFFNGQIFDAYVLMSSLIKEAKKSVVLIDNYIDETTLVHLSNKAPKGVSITVLTKVVSKGLRLDLKKHNKQYATIEVKQLKHAHDRFLLIDEKIYHLGASLKDLGKKWFAFSLIEEDVFELKKKIGEVLDEQ